MKLVNIKINILRCTVSKMLKFDINVYTRTAESFTTRVNTRGSVPSYKNFIM